MAKDNTSRYIMLGILSIGPMSGYDMKDWITTTVGNFWSISYGQIYPALKEFTKEGLVSFRSERDGIRPEKRVYQITQKGLEVLRQWLTEPIDFSAGDAGKVLLVKVFFGSNVPLETTIQHIMDSRKNESRKLEHLIEIKKCMDETKEQLSLADLTIRNFRMYTLNKGISNSKAHIQWCDDTLSSLRSQTYIRSDLL